MKLICIPAYDVEDTIFDIVKSSLPFCDKVIVCDDGSRDKTAQLAKNAGAIVISHKKNMGYGAAIITLFDVAKKDHADAIRC